MEASRLRRDAVTGAESTLIAISSVSPANVFATSTAALVAAVGFSGPGALLFGAIPMFGIALAYFYLNAWRSDAGAAYSWVGRALVPELGFFAGWALLIANALFMVVGTLPVASATLDIIAPSMASNTADVTIVGFVWFVIIVAIVLLGIKATAEVQRVLTLVQVAAILAFAAFALGKGLHAPANALAILWFSPIGPDGFRSFWAGALVTIFYFWGWDVSCNLTEETVDRHRTPGLAAIAGVVIILALFVISQVSAQLVMTPASIAAASSNILVAYADVVAPQAWGALAIAIIIFASVATVQVTIVQAGRTMFSMGRDRVLDERLAKLHPKYLTPWNATFVFAIIAVSLFALATTSPSVNQLLKDAINAEGVLVAVYYGLSGIACAAYYARVNGSDRLMWILRGLWPAAAALFVFAVAIAQLASAGLRSDAAVLGFLFVGIVPMLLYRRAYGSEFYTLPPERASR